VGQWRDMEVEGAPVDASGAVPGGKQFQGIDGLEDALLARPELEMLCGPDHDLPPGVVRHEWAGGAAWLAPSAVPTSS